ncbi:PfkB family carbohydrate kinase, partial [Streptomyces lavendulae]|uniref:PfkB family carbohydrate kinase n=1 Tax=Streptomyces lavendulae TaxID=1914 RepID=UPI00368E01B3
PRGRSPPLAPRVSGGAGVARPRPPPRVRTVLTPAPARPLPRELLELIDLLVPNEHEAAALTGLTDPLAAAEALLHEVPEVVVTLGAAGALYAARGREPVTVPAPRVRAVDTTGAGDTFVGALAVALGEGRPMPEALAWATRAAALAVQRPGAQPSMPTRADLGHPAPPAPAPRSGAATNTGAGAEAGHLPPAGGVL